MTARDRVCSWCHADHRPQAGGCSIPLVGEVLAGKYRIVRLMGEGGMAAVYEAQHTEIGRRFAVKFLRPDALVDHQGVLERFQHEARAVGSLESENVAGAVDFGYTTKGIPYFVMEHLVGEDLATLLAREAPLTVPHAVGIIIQACRGLGTAHAAGIVHRDVKPENLFLCMHGDGSVLVKVLDFGIAKLMRRKDLASLSLQPRADAGATMGTPYYMPPEQARGDEAIDHRADLYALGVILFEALSAEMPHHGDSYSAILLHVLTQPPTPIETLRPTLPRELAAIIRRALSPDPADRQASAAALASDLAPFVNARGDTSVEFLQWLHRKRRGRTLAPTGSAALVAGSSLAPARGRRKRDGLGEKTRGPLPRRRRARYLLGLAAAGLLAACAILAVHNNGCFDRFIRRGAVTAAPATAPAPPAVAP